MIVWQRGSYPRPFRSHSCYCLVNATRLKDCLKVTPLHYPVAVASHYIDPIGQHSKPVRYRHVASVCHRQEPRHTSLFEALSSVMALNMPVPQDEQSVLCLHTHPSSLRPCIFVRFLCMYKVMPGGPLGVMLKLLHSKSFVKVL